MRRITLVILLAAGALAPAAGVFAQVTPAKPAGLGIRLVDVPASRANDPRAQTYVVDHVPPGTTVRRKIEIRNDTDGPTQVRIYAGAARIQNGAFVPASDERAGDIPQWVSLSAANTSLARGATRQIDVTINIPQNTSGGERYGVVWAELPPVRGRTGISEINRVGIRIYLSVGSGSEPATSFNIESLTAKRLGNGVPAVAAQVRNTGGRAIDLSGELSLANGPGGTKAGPFPAKLGTTLAPGSRASVEVPLPRDLPAGPWDAQLTLSSGTVTHEAKARITFPSTPGTASRAAAATTEAIGGGENDDGSDSGPVLAVLGVIALLAILAVLLLVLLAQRRRNESG